MPYSINHSDPNKTPIVVNDGTVDTSTPVRLIGKNTTRFGEFVNENFLNLVENFASANPPVNPVEGTLWYDNSENILFIYDSGKWYPIGFTGNTRIEVRNIEDTNGNMHRALVYIVEGVINNIAIGPHATEGTNAWTPANTEFAEDGVTLLSENFPVMQVGINMTNRTDFKFRGTATSAEYADLAERYAADEVLEAGTVVKIGGPNEIIPTGSRADTDVFGIISTAPGFEMNAAAGTDETHPYVALAGRVPCKVSGKIRKGDRLVSSLIHGHAEVALPSDILDYRTIIGRALEDHAGGEGVIEVVVGAK
jgi:hypothetical protein